MVSLVLIVSSQVIIQENMMEHQMLQMDHLSEQLLAKCTVIKSITRNTTKEAITDTEKMMMKRVLTKHQLEKVISVIRKSSQIYPSVMERMELQKSIV
jgi:hypothetical protein